MSMYDLCSVNHFGAPVITDMADSTKAMRKSIVDRDILPAFENRQLNEITADDLRALCNKVKARGAPATAVHVRDIVKQVYAFAILHGEKVDNPAEGVGDADRGGAGQGCRSAAGAFHRPRPTPYRLDAVERNRLQP